MAYCKICGDEKTVQYRERSRMYLCDYCHQDTPAKAGFEEFLRVTGMPEDRTAREFFSDYKASTYSKVSEYWDACSS